MDTPLLNYCIVLGSAQSAQSDVDPHTDIQPNVLGSTTQNGIVLGSTNGNVLVDPAAQNGNVLVDPVLLLRLEKAMAYADDDQNWSPVMQKLALLFIEDLSFAGGSCFGAGFWLGLNYARLFGTEDFDVVGR